nr:hypothetical protein CFP56_33973 [Quercus suber]
MEKLFFYESSKVALTGELMVRKRSTKMILLWCFLQVLLFFGELDQVCYNLALDSSGDPSDLCCIGKLILTIELLFKIESADIGGLLLDESSSPIGFGGMKSNDSVDEMHDRHTHLFYVGIPHFGSPRLYFPGVKDLLDFAGIKDVPSFAGIKDLLSFIGIKDLPGFASWSQGSPGLCWDHGTTPFC